MVSYLPLIGISLVFSGPVSVVYSQEETTGGSTTDEPAIVPDFIIYLDDYPCLLATINVTVRISYKAQSGILNEVYNKDVLLPVEEEPVVNGSCEGNVTYLALTWWDGLMGLNFTFIRKMEAISEDLVTGDWWLSEVNLFYDTSNSSIFPEAIKGGMEVLTKDKMELFKSPLGLSFLCDAQEKVTVGPRENAAILSFRHVHLQPFMVMSDRFSKANECDQDVEIVLARKDAFIVPVIVACCLAAICIIVVIGYAISRKVNKFQNQSSYKPMD